MKTLIISTVAAMVIAYLMFAFTMNNLNPSTWAINARFFLSVLWFFIIYISLAYYKIEIKK